MCFKAIAVRGLLAQLIGGVLGVFLAARGAGIWSLVVMQIIARVVELAFTWTLSDFRPAVRSDWEAFRQLFGFGLSVLASRVVLFVSERSPQFLIPALLGSKAAGYYFLAYRIIDVLVLLMVRPATVVLFPALARLQHDRERMRRMFLRALELTAAIATPVFVGVALVAQDLVPLLWGERWAIAAWIIVVLTPFGVFRSLVLLTQQGILATGRPGLNLIVNLVSTAMVVSLIVSIASFGIVAVAATMNAQLLLVVPMSMWFLMKVIDIRAWDSLKVMVPSFGSAIIMAVVVLGCQSFLIDGHHRVINIVVAALLGIMIYAVALRIWVPDTVALISSAIRELAGRRKGNKEPKV
jgi:PST family polysaccharide transporter